MTYMKKLSFALLTGLSILAISAFTFCSSADAKAADGEITPTENIKSKAPAAQTVADKKTPQNKKAAKPKSSEELVSIDPVSKEEDGLTWYFDLNAAQQASEKSSKPILGFFTGSDWCGWCIKLQKNVFSKDEFKTWAKENVILMEIDFPRRTQQEADLAAQNRNLQQLFKVTGYPTVFYFTGENNKETGKLNLSIMGKTGYPRSQPGQEAATFIKASENVINPPSSPKAQ